MFDSIVRVFEGGYCKSSKGTNSREGGEQNRCVLTFQDVKRITKGCRSVAQFIEMVDDKNAIIQISDSSSMYSPVLEYPFSPSLPLEP